MTQDTIDTFVTKRANTPATPTGDEVLAGGHIIAPFLVKVDQEWQPDDKAAQRFKDSVSKKVEQLLNNTSMGAAPGDDTETGAPGVSPDLFYDTGYVKLVCENNSNHLPGQEAVEITHNLGQIPSRFTIFFSDRQEPDPNNTEHHVYLVAPANILDHNDERVGFQIRFTGTNKLQIRVAADRCFQSGKPLAPSQGHFRILMWR